MRIPILLAAALAAAAALAPAASAQDLVITIVDLPPGPARVTAGATHTVGFSVQVEMTGVQCAEQGTLALALALTNAAAAPTGTVPSVDPANITIDVPVGVYGLPVGDPGLPVAPAPPLNTSVQATLRIETSAASSGNFGASVTASYPGGAPATASGTGCIGALPEATNTATHAVTITGTGGNDTGPGPIGGGPGPGTGNNTTQPPPAEPARTPGLAPLAGAGAVALLAMAVRRRRA